MKKFIAKPWLAGIACVAIALAIAYIQSQKITFKVNAENTNGNRNSGSDGQDGAGTLISGLVNDKNKNESGTVLRMNPEPQEKRLKYSKAPDFIGIENWINSPPLKIAQLRGNVVLVDFWTYTCINCIRTLPYLKDWYNKYGDKGLVIVGVHTPEFDFEKKAENVQNAAAEYELKYPIAQDNFGATWNLYKNKYWPHEYLVDVDGYIRYDHVGEGNYDKTEKMIQDLLKERMERLNQKNGIDTSIARPKGALEVDFSNVGTPEIYFGYQFTRGNFGNEEGIKQDETINYRAPSEIEPNNAYLVGNWKNNADNMELAESQGSILLDFDAKKANMVAGSQKKSRVIVKLDGKEEQSNFNITEFKLYNAASADKYGRHMLRIDIKGEGFKIYTFTFG